jgi:predicted RNA-binding Zn ribbon-like protein
MRRVDTDAAARMPDDDAGAAHPLSVEFANTRYMVRGQLRDGIDTPQRLLSWLAEHAETLGPAGMDAELGDEIEAHGVGDFLSLRETIRSLFAQASAHRVGSPADIDRLNRAALASPGAPTLVVHDTGYRIVRHGYGSGVPVALGAIARDAIHLLGAGPTRRVRSCGGPACVLFFVSNDPRRKWCCPACGNRARAARHYLRHRDG